MIDSVSMPTWMQIIRLVLTFLVCAGCGIHAYASFKTQPLAARRWMFFIYSVVFLFSGLMTFAYLMISVKMGGYSKGPVQLGMFNLMLILSYFTLNYGVGKRDYTWNVNLNRQDRIK